ncbi:MAG: hypothetical protein HYS27_08175 [Deltaproteobacteria bacterium]|nr:hypothetical protein [Deltaproteobacteria bacterium]
MIARTLAFALAAALALTLVGATSCTKDDKKEEPANKPPPKAPSTPPQAAVPPPGTDADAKRAAALALAKGIDDGLAGFTRVEKELAAEADGKARAAEAWHVGKLPKKLVIKIKDATGVVADTTDFYFDDAGHLAFVRAPDGLFVFSMESLALWLDREQRVKRGVTPGDARTRVDALKLQSAKALSTLGVR